MKQLVHMQDKPVTLRCVNTYSCIIIVLKYYTLHCVLYTLYIKNFLLWICSIVLKWMIPVCHFSDSSRTSLSLLWRQTVRGLSACLLSMVGKRHITNIWSSFNSTTSSCSSGVQTLSLLWVRWLWQGRLHPTTGLLINPMTCLPTRCVPLWADPSGMALEK